MPAASFTVEVAWESAVTLVFKLDVSTLDSGSVLDGTGVGDFTGAYDNVTNDVEDVRIKRGRDDRLRGMQAGEATFVLYRPSAPDFYNPNAPGGVSALGTLTPGFVPMRPVRIRATYNATTYSLFYGFIRSAEWDSVTKRCTVNCVDLFLWMSRVLPDFTAADASTAGVTSTSTAVGYILDQIGFTDPTKRNLDSGGDTIALTSYTDGSVNALAIVEELLEAERGVFYIQGDGTARYRTRRARYQTDTSATFANETLAYGSGLDLDRIVNRQSVTRQDASRADVYSVTKTDGTSVATYGLSDGSTIASPYISSNANADALAQYLVDAGAVPRPPISLTIDNQDATTIARQLSLDIGDRITAPTQYASFIFGTSTFGGTGTFSGQADYHIEQIQHDLDHGGVYHRTTYVLSERGSEFFRFGDLPAGTDLSPSQFGSASAVFGF